MQLDDDDNDDESVVLQVPDQRTQQAQTGEVGKE